MKLTQVRVILVWVKRRFWFGHSTERYLACPMDDYAVFVYQGNTIIRSCRHYWFCRTRTFYCHFINKFWPILVEIHLKSNKNYKYKQIYRTILSRLYQILLKGCQNNTFFTIGNCKKQQKKDNAKIGTSSWYTKA